MSGVVTTVALRVLDDVQGVVDVAVEEIRVMKVIVHRVRQVLRRGSTQSERRPGNQAATRSRDVSSNGARRACRVAAIFSSISCTFSPTYPSCIHLCADYTQGKDAHTCLRSSRAIALCHNTEGYPRKSNIAHEAAGTRSDEART